MATTFPAIGPSFELSATINRRLHVLQIEVRETLAQVLRDRLGLSGTKVGCDSEICGACTVLLDNRIVSACTVLAYEAHQREVLTIEGLDTEDGLDPVQQAFLAAGGFQCGFCTPGMILAVKALLAEHPSPAPERIRTYLRGNLCRCTGYKSIFSAVAAASREAAQ